VQNYRAHLAHLKYTLLHKYYVVVASRLVGVPLLQALLHDLSKFSPAEWSGYATSFFNPDGTRRKGKGTAAFDLAWLHHQKRNLHHHQAWTLVKDHGTTLPLSMPERYVREMVADWIAAGAAQGHGIDMNEVVAWWKKNRTGMNLHPDTYSLVEIILSDVSCHYNIDQWRGVV
jgi:hypothetical protein